MFHILEKHEQKSQYLTYEQMNLINQFRKHYTDTIIWGRALVTASKFNSNNVEAIYEKLLSEPYDTYETFRTFFGAEISEQYLNLFTKQIITYKNLVDAMIANDAKAAQDSYNQLYQTADEIAEFFARLNPYWEDDVLKNLQYQILNLVYQETLAIISEEYKKEIEIFDRLTDYTNMFADYISRGIMQNLYIPTVINNFSLF